MAQVKIYPSTQAQVQAVQNTVDEINAKITTPNYQVKTVAPSNVQQTVQADSGYTALSGVVVNPIAALMPENLEDYILRKDTMPEFTLSLSGDVPAYACFSQTKLVEVYGTPTSIASYAFSGCSELLYINCKNVGSIGSYAFANTKIKSLDLRNLSSVPQNGLRDMKNLEYVDLRQISTLESSSLFSDSSLIIIDITDVDNPPTIHTIIQSEGAWKAVCKNDTVKAAVQAATNWSTYASHIYTVAEIEALYGDTYDNLYLQWFGHARN